MENRSTYLKELHLHQVHQRNDRTYDRDDSVDNLDPRLSFEQSQELSFDSRRVPLLETLQSMGIQRLTPSEESQSLEKIEEDGVEGGNLDGGEDNNLNNSSQEY